MSPERSLSHDLADASLAGHSFILIGNVAPLPMVDKSSFLNFEFNPGGLVIDFPVMGQARLLAGRLVSQFGF